MGILLQLRAAHRHRGVDVDQHLLHRRAAGLSLHADGREGRADARQVGLGHPGDGARAGDSGGKRHNIRFSGGEIVTQPDHGRTEPRQVVLARLHDVAELGKRHRRLFHGEVGRYPQLGYQSGEIDEVFAGDAELAAQFADLRQLGDSDGDLQRQLPEALAQFLAEGGEVPTGIHHPVDGLDDSGERRFKLDAGRYG